MESSKQAVITGAAGTVTDVDLEVNKVVISNDNGKFAAALLDADKLMYLDNVTDDIQGQFNAITQNTEVTSINTRLLTAEDNITNIGTSIGDINNVPNNLNVSEYLQRIGDVSGYTISDNLISKISGDITVIDTTLDGALKKIGSLDGYTNESTLIQDINATNINVNSTLSGLESSKQAVITGAVEALTDNNLLINRAVISDNNGKVIVSEITSDELHKLKDVSENIQSQFDTITQNNSSLKVNNLLPINANNIAIAYQKSMSDNLLPRFENGILDMYNKGKGWGLYTNELGLSDTVNSTKWRIIYKRQVTTRNNDGFYIGFNHNSDELEWYGGGGQYNIGHFRIESNTSNYNTSSNGFLIYDIEDNVLGNSLADNGPSNDGYFSTTNPSYTVISRLDNGTIEIKLYDYVFDFIWGVHLRINDSEPITHSKDMLFTEYHNGTYGKLLGVLVEKNNTTISPKDLNDMLSIDDYVNLQINDNDYIENTKYNVNMLVDLIDDNIYKTADTSINTALPVLNSNGGLLQNSYSAWGVKKSVFNARNINTNDEWYVMFKTEKYTSIDNTYPYDAIRLIFNVDPENYSTTNKGDSGGEFGLNINVTNTDSIVTSDTGSGVYMIENGGSTSALSAYWDSVSYTLIKKIPRNPIQIIVYGDDKYTVLFTMTLKKSENVVFNNDLPVSFYLDKLTTTYHGLVLSKNDITPYDFDKYIETSNTAKTKILNVASDVVQQQLNQIKLSISSAKKPVPDKIFRCNPSIQHISDNINIFPGDSKEFTIEFWLYCHSESHSPSIISIVNSELDLESFNNDTMSENCLMHLVYGGNGLSLNGSGATNGNGLPYPRTLESINKKWVHFILQGDVTNVNNNIDLLIKPHLQNSYMQWDYPLYELTNDDNQNVYSSPKHFDSYKIILHPGGDGRYITGLRIFNKKIYKKFNIGNHSNNLFDTIITDENAIINYIDEITPKNSVVNYKNSNLNFSSYDNDAVSDYVNDSGLIIDANDYP